MKIFQMNTAHHPSKTLKNDRDLIFLIKQFPLCCLTKSHYTIFCNMPVRHIVRISILFISPPDIPVLYISMSIQHSVHFIKLLLANILLLLSSLSHFVHDFFCVDVCFFFHFPFDANHIFVLNFMEQRLFCFGTVLTWKRA